MSTWQTKDFYVDTSKNTITTNVHGKMVEPNLYYESHCLFRWHVTSNGSTPVNLTGATFDFKIASGYTHSTTLVESDNSDFISVEWTSWSLTNGRICCRVDLGDSRIGTYLGTDESANAHCVLWATISGVRYVLASFDATIKNTILP